jgi:O-Antigen ligase
MDRLWSWAILVFLAFLLVIGIFAEAYPNSIYIPPIISLVFLLCATWRLRRGLPSALSARALGIIALGLIWMGLQLVPLPASVWAKLPGHGFVLDTLTAAKLAPTTMPVSLAPTDGLLYFLFLLSGLAIFVGGLSIPAPERRFVAFGICVLAIISSLLGLAQRFGGDTSILQFYASSGWNNGGFFSNHNFLAAQLYCAIPFAASLAIALGQRRSVHWAVAALFAFATLIVYLAGLGATSSRAGIILAMVSVLLSGLLLWPRPHASQLQTSNISSRAMIVFIAATLLLAAQFGLAGILRLAQNEPVSDYRGIMASTSLEVARGFFPFGSGFGSFVPVYAMFEHPENLKAFYVNHAHNDWIELFLEGGLPMAVVLFLFIAWLCRAIFILWRNAGPEDGLTKACVIIIGLILAHSLSDYPLRTRFMMAVFALCCAWLAAGPLPIAPKARRAGPNVPIMPSVGAMPMAPRRDGPYFAPRPKPPEN